MIRIVAKYGNKFSESLCDNEQEMLDAIKYKVNEEGFPLDSIKIANENERGWE